MTYRIYDPEVVASRIKQLRKEKGITQLELADGTKLGLSTIKQYESKKRVPDKHNLSVIANYFGVLEDWLIGKTEYRTWLSKFDEELGNKGIKEMNKRIGFLQWLESEFNISTENYPPEEIDKLEAEIRDFITFKVESLKKSQKIKKE